MTIPAQAFRKLVNRHAEDIPVRRRDDTTSSQYGSSITYSDIGTRRFIVTSLDESVDATIAGERQAGRAVAYSDESVDLQVNDRFDYGGKTFEVLTKEGMPTENSATIYRYELDNDV